MRMAELLAYTTQSHTVQEYVFTFFFVSDFEKKCLLRLFLNGHVKKSSVKALFLPPVFENEFTTLLSDQNSK